MAEEAERFIREVWGLQGTAYLFVGLRYYSRIRTLGIEGLAWDDAVMAVATLVYTAESVAAYFVVAYWRGLANNAMTDEQRATLDPDSEEWLLRVNGSKTHVIGLILYTTLLWLLKGCWIIYYARLTSGVPKLRKFVRWSGFIMAVTYVSCLLVAFLKCIPFDYQWQVNPSPGNKCMPAISFIQTIYVMAMNTITDFILMAIPIPMVWKTSLPPRKKFTLLVMFSGGILEMVFGILRCVSILTVGDRDPAQSGYWSVRESFVCFILTNMPIVYSLFRSAISKVWNPSKSSGIGTGESRGYRLDCYAQGTRTGNGAKNLTRVSMAPNKPKWRSEGDSEENIIICSDQVTTSSGDEAPCHPTGPNEILVTKEYTVLDTGVNVSKDGGRSKF